MGGVINVAIRLKDGRAFCQERWTNNMPHWFQDPKMFDGDEEHVLGYINMVSDNDWIADRWAPGRPQPVENSEYGLIVWDFKAGLILDNNHYSCPVDFDVVMVGGVMKRENFDLLAKAGRIFRRTYHYPAKGSVREAYFTDTPPLSYEDATRMAEEAHKAEYGGNRPKRDPDAGFDIIKFMVNPAPLQYMYFGDHEEMHDYDDESEGPTPLHPEYLAKLKEVDFPMTEAEGLNADLSYTVPEFREVSRQEEVARELYHDYKRSDEGGVMKGIAFDDAPETLQAALMDAASKLMADSRAFDDYNLAKLLGSSSMVVKVDVGRDAGTESDA